MIVMPVLAITMFFVAQALPNDIAPLLNYGLGGVGFVMVVTGKLRLEREVIAERERAIKAETANETILRALESVPSVSHAALEAIDTVRKMLEDLQRDLWETSD